MSCEIKIDLNNIPTGTTYPSLMRDILEYTNFDTEYAIELYGVVLTEDFAEMGLSNPSLDNLLTFIEKDNIESALPLNVEEKQKVLDMSLQQTYIPDVKKTFIDAFTVNGEFNISAYKLQESGLFSDAEILSILNSEDLTEFQDLYYKLNNSTEEFEGTVSDYVLRDGLFTRLNPDKIVQDIYDNYVGMTTFNQVLDKANEIGDEVILNNPSLISTVLNTVKDKQGLIQYETDEYTGEIKKKFQDDTLVRIEQTLDIQQDFRGLLQQVEYLKLQSESTFIQDFDILNYYIQNIEKQAELLGLDLNGFAEAVGEKTHEQLNDFMDDLYNFIYDIASKDAESLQETLVNYSQSYDAFFSVEQKSSKKIVDKLEEDSVYLYLESDRSEEELFGQNSIIKSQDNIYQKINDNKSLDELYDLIYDNPNLIPDNVFSVEIKESNLDIIREDLDKYISAQSKNLVTETSNVETLKKIVAYKILTGVELNQESKKPTIVGQIKIDPITFISDFHKEYISNPVIRDNFYFSQRGLEARNEMGGYTSRQIKNNVSQGLFEGLIQYSTVSGNESLSYFADMNRLEDSSMDSIRDYYANNLNELKPLEQEYVRKRQYVVANSTADFINVENKLYEKVDESGIYAQVETNGRYLNYNLEKPAYDGSVEADYTARDIAQIKIQKPSRIEDDNIEFC